MKPMDDPLDALFGAARRETPPAFASVSYDVIRRLRAARFQRAEFRWPSLRLIASMGGAAAMVAIMAFGIAQTREYEPDWEEQVFSEPCALDEIAWAYAF